VLAARTRRGLRLARDDRLLLLLLLLRDDDLSCSGA